jgi:eukaryotic-like serine/threonine-protein kinase
MPLIRGVRLGPYEIEEPIGSGGMGEVYRARDTRLERRVALKVLPPELSEDADRLRRFDQEARATGALNHPNILAIHDVGSHQGKPYVVYELLEGVTLADRLASGPIPSTKAVGFAIQIARGLAAAHEQNIVHRDLKPQNIFITNDGFVKILDFGLAKIVPENESAALASQARTMQGQTDPGIVMGTIGYMSPEQVRGQNVDHRSDIFAFGAILYEMLSGRSAFRRDSPADTMSAILKEEPADFAADRIRTSPGVEKIVRRCLEKRAAQRFRSASDLSFALETLSTLSASGETAVVPAAGLGAGRVWLMALAALMLVAVASFFVGRRFSPSMDVAAGSPSFQPLTFRSGTIRTARFTPDGKSIVYGAAWDGEPLKIFVTRPESPESSRLPLPDGDILSISNTGELLVSIGRRFDNWLASGNLARAPLVGGGPREILQEVRAAEWAPDGKDFAVIRRVDGHDRLEYPIGKVLGETAGYYSHPRFSPQGDVIALLDHPVYGGNRGSVALFDLTGNKKNITGEWASIEGLAWSPPTGEIWFTAIEGTDAGRSQILYGVTRAGKQRIVLQVPGDLTIYDIAPDGRVLLSRDNHGDILLGRGPTDDREHDLAAFSFSYAADLSSDGRLALITDFGLGMGIYYSVFVRPTDGSPAVRIGEGRACALSTDAKSALAIVWASPAYFSILPVGAGDTRRVPVDSVEPVSCGAWFPDGKRIAFIGKEAGTANRYYVQNVSDGKASPISAEGIEPAPGSSLSAVVSTDTFSERMHPAASSFTRPMEPAIRSRYRVHRATSRSGLLTKSHCTSALSTSALGRKHQHLSFKYQDGPPRSRPHNYGVELGRYRPGSVLRSIEP